MCIWQADTQWDVKRRRERKTTEPHLKGKGGDGDESDDDK